MVCVAVKGRPIIGVIHDPFTQRTTWAWHGNLVSEDLAKVKRDDSGKPKNPIIIVSRSHSGEVKELTKRTFGENASVISAGGAGMWFEMFVHLSPQHFTSFDRLQNNGSRFE